MTQQSITVTSLPGFVAGDWVELNGRVYVITKVERHTLTINGKWYALAWWWLKCGVEGLALRAWWNVSRLCTWLKLKVYG